MGKEIERRFLVDKAWRKMITLPLVSIETIKQAYICADNGVTTRVRIYQDQHAELTIKGKTIGISKPEFNIPIALNDAKEMMKLSWRNVIKKKRYTYNDGDYSWEIDVFSGINKGLIIAEVELLSPKQKINISYPWLLNEITNNKRFSNFNLTMNPYRGNHD